MLPKFTEELSVITTSLLLHKLLACCTVNCASGSAPLTVNGFMVSATQPSTDVTVNDTLYTPIALYTCFWDLDLQNCSGFPGLRKDRRNSIERQTETGCLFSTIEALTNSAKGSLRHISGNIKSGFGRPVRLKVCSKVSLHCLSVVVTRLTA